MTFPMLFCFSQNLSVLVFCFELQWRDIPINIYQSLRVPQGKWSHQENLIYLETSDSRGPKVDSVIQEITKRIKILDFILLSKSGHQ